ncbi:hypothetical protein Verru16b_00191 [Lacunisphaera limnophila]|uniref:DUF2442 domain-containing protein n=1 Tax=Lacunisphaera limnophila TaxID=1838286 RepID=A0A1I7PHQ9_9BACT|nr:DUF2442 domain-containing protein [Lacunisphaera limnophila]AOS43150.1 hypothetical protein Verru16b_00191 [Lacunisphaera limnophila]
MDTALPAAPRLAALRCWMQGRRVYLEITERRRISFPTSKYDQLAYASQVELEKIHLHDEGRVIRWDSLDEEIQVEDVANSRYTHTARSVPFVTALAPEKPAPKYTF